MKLTLSDYADLIISNVYAGTKGLTNFALSKEAVEAEFVLGSRAIIRELDKAAKLEPEEFFQTIPKIKLSELAEKSDVPIGDNPDKRNGKVFFAEIPELLWITGRSPIDYIGPFNVFYQYTVKKGNSFRDQKYSRFHANEPTVWVKENKVYVINNLPNVTHLQLRAIFKDPSELLQEEDAYPIPSDAGDMLVNKMTERLIRYYRLQQPQPNTQNDITNTPAQ